MDSKHKNLVKVTVILVFALTFGLALTNKQSHAQEWTVKHLPFNNGALTDLHFMGKNTGWVVGIDSDTNITVFSYTTNSGNNWVTQDTTWIALPLPFTEGEIYDIDFMNNNIGWCVGYDANAEEAVYYTISGGEAWIVQPVGFDGFLGGVHFIDENTGYAVGYDNNGDKIVILKTINSGGQWQRQTLSEIQGSLLNVFCVDANHAWAVGEDWDANDLLILQTTDGTNWAKANHPAHAGRLNAVHFVNASLGWTVGWDQYSNVPIILSTNDGGQNWIEQTLPISSGNLLDVFCVNADTGWIVGTTGSEAILLHTTNGGETWNFLTPPVTSEATVIYFNSPVSGYMMTNFYENENESATVFETTDGGNNWTQIFGAIPTYVASMSLVEGSFCIIAAGRDDGDDDNVRDNYLRRACTIDECFIKAEISPSSKAGTITPSGLIKCNCGVDEIKFEAEAADGWEFSHFEPAGNTHTCPDQGTKTVKAVFRPYLTITGTTSSFLCTNEENKNIAVLPFSLKASKADDWFIDSITFGTSGSGNEMDDITEVKLYEDGQQIGSGKTFDQDNGDLLFDIGSVIQADQSKNYILYFDFKKIDDCPEECRLFNITIKGLYAEPQQYAPGYVHGNANGKVEIGCIGNVTKGECYSTIQAAVDAASSGNVIEVCPGIYELNSTLEITKNNLTIRSTEGVIVIKP